MSNRQGRHERKEKCVALKKQFDDLGIRLYSISEETGYSASYISRAWNENEPTIAPSPVLLTCLEEALLKRRCKLRGMVDGERAAVVLLDTCNAPMAKLCAKTREDMAQGVRSRLFSPKTEAPTADTLPDQVAGAIFKIEDGCPKTSLFVVVVRSGNDAEEMAAMAHELQDLSRDYAFKAKKLRRASDGPLVRPLPRAAF